MRPDPVRVAIHLVVYVLFYLLSTAVLGWALAGLGYLLGMILTSLLSAVAANWLVLRIFEARDLPDAGLWWNRSSRWNLAIGFAGGAGAAALVLGPPLLFHAAKLAPIPMDRPTAGTFLFVAALLAAGSWAEELLFRGYGFQILLTAAGPYATILPVGVLFALLHSNNPHATWLGLANTAGFGILFGYAYLRSRDLWLPAGLHFGWNFTLPLFGANLSGFTMDVTGREMAWRAGALWSGGAYGPEASVLTSAVLVLLTVYLWRAPVRRQHSPISDLPAEQAVCDRSPLSPF